MQLPSPFKTQEHPQMVSSHPAWSVIHHFKNLASQPKLLVVGLYFFCYKFQRLNHLLLNLPASHNGINECWERCFVLAERRIATHSLLKCKDTHSATGAGPGRIQFLKVIERLFWEVNGSAVLLKEVSPAQRLCHFCERWCVALTTYTFRNKLRIIAEENSSQPSYLCRGVNAVQEQLE